MAYKDKEKKRATGRAWYAARTPMRPSQPGQSASQDACAVGRIGHSAEILHAVTVHHPL